jgi:regulator of sigma E protease
LETLTSFFNILQVVLGLGFVIFLHELGHFLVAKWCGVYVKSFSIGFPPTIFAKKWGETTYKIGILFLGGYVAMLGEGSEGEEDPGAADDPRSFRNKSASARIAILSAGVVMNILLGLGFFITTHMVGTDTLPCRIGGVTVGSPAYMAGIRPGDEIVGIDGDSNVNYIKLKLRVSLSGAGKVLRFDVKRPGVKDPIPFDITPVRSKTAKAPAIGVLQSAGMELAINRPFEAPAGMSDKTKVEGEFKGLDRIVEVGPVGGTKRQITLPSDLDLALVELRDKPLEVVVEHDKEGEAAGRKATVTVPVTHFVKFGFRTSFGPIKDFAGGSIGQKAGFKPGDVIAKVDGRDDLDPFDLPIYCYEHAGQPIKFVVRRTEGGEAKEVEITATPDRSLPWVEPMLSNEPFEIPGLGMALDVDPTIAAVDPKSPAEMNGIKPGFKIATIEVIEAKNEVKSGEEPSKPIDLSTVPAWPYVYDMIQQMPKAGVRFTFVGQKNPVTITPVPDTATFHPYRGLRRIIDRIQMPPQAFGSAFKLAIDDTYENVISIYAMIRSLFQGRVSTENLAGIKRIGDMAYESANAGFVHLLQFLAMLSINLAVLNFMPIPPLDGGQITLILAEKVRGRPLPPALFNAVMLVGFVLIVGLMLFTNGQDIWIWIKGDK